MLPDLLRTSIAGLRLEGHDVDGDNTTVTFTLAATRAQARCPLCARPSARVHSRYQRIVADLPWMGRAVRLRLRVRRFFCDHQDCPRRVFVERLTGLVAPWGRRTQRLREAQQQIGLHVGGEGGARLSERLAMRTSPDTLLRLVCAVTLPRLGTLHALGVDDWALCTGHTYGTILVDLEAHRIVDLLPDRCAETLAQWLQAHPGVAVIARDRFSAYAEGASAGAPEAVQVTDRFHLLGNLRELYARVLERHPGGLHAAVVAPEEAVAAVEAPRAPVAAKDVPEIPRAPEPSPAAQRRQQRYEDIQRLQRQGLTQQAIAGALQLDRKTVRRYLRAPSPPPSARRRRRRPGVLDPHVEYLHRRLREGCDNGARLYREIREQGYRGSYGTLRAWLAPRRPRALVDSATGQSPPPRTRHSLSVRQGAWLLAKQPEALDEEEARQVERMRAASVEVGAAYTLGQRFAGLVRQREAEGLPGWLEAAEGSEVSEIARFAAGIRRDQRAVVAALELPWSNGQTEGHVNRLKLVKRQMYGRGSLQLLKQRLLAA
jgi:transposase